jgi:DNA ligase-1
MSLIVKPMLAVAVKDFDSITYPVIATPKIDGIRCIKTYGKALSRKFKPIKNDFIRNTIEKLVPDGTDGEIVCGENFQETSSAVMTIKGMPTFTYYVFDYVRDGLYKPYKERVVEAEKMVSEIRNFHIGFLEYQTIQNKEELLDYEEKMVDLGYEGVMLRSLDGPYKCGRSTLREGYLLKVKRFIDSEAVILDFFEGERNENEGKRNAVGQLERSSAKANMVPNGMVGAFFVRDVSSGIEFSIGGGIGLTLEMRKEMWDNKDKYIGKIIKYKSQPTGVKDAPRFPTFLGFRDEDDM